MGTFQCGVCNLIEDRISKNTILETIRLAQLETIDEAIKVLEKERDIALAFDSILSFDEMKQKLYKLKKEITNGKEN